MTDSSSFSFILMPEFSMMALTAAIEPLRHANGVLGKAHYSWALYSKTGSPVSSSSGIEINPKGDIEAVDLRSTIVLCSGPNVMSHTSAGLLAWFRRAARHAPTIGGLCTASRVLAEAGVLDGYKATIHWESLEAFRESFPKVSVSENLFEIDRNRFTCAGETAGIDMMVTLLAARHGNLLAARVAEQVLHTRVRPKQEGQKLALQIRLGTRSPQLLHAVQLMESHVEEPLDVGTLVGQLGCSRRQLERHFKKYLRCPPRIFYRNLRLDRARGLLLETDLKYSEISVACGFKSFGSFSRAYRGRFGQTPHHEKGMPT